MPNKRLAVITISANCRGVIGTISVIPINRIKILNLVCLNTSFYVLCWTSARTSMWTIISMHWWWFPLESVITWELYPWCMSRTTRLRLFPPLVLLGLWKHFGNQLDSIEMDDERDKPSINEHISLCLCVDKTIVHILQTLSTMNVAPHNTKSKTLHLCFHFVKSARLVLCDDMTGVDEVSYIGWPRILWIGCLYQPP